MPSKFVGVESMSRPTWARGLKPRCLVLSYQKDSVAPHVGAWIETHISLLLMYLQKSRAPRGRVD